LKTDKEKYNTKKNENKVLYKYYHWSVVMFIR
jgi:hypothetical protein